MSRLHGVALGAAFLLTSARASAWEPEVLGLDDAPGVQLRLNAPGQTPPDASIWDPAPVGQDDAAYAGAYATLSPADGFALVTPEMIQPVAGDCATPALAATAAGQPAPAATTKAAGERLACECHG